jgi:hypothetical protein
LPCGTVVVERGGVILDMLAAVVEVCVGVARVLTLYTANFSGIILRIG